MTESEYSRQMAAVVAGLAPMLKERGFRKRRHSFNRASNDTVQVIDFQMARPEVAPPRFTDEQKKELAEARQRVLGPSMYGHFKVNLGVYIPAAAEVAAEVARLTFDASDAAAARPAAWINEYDCQIRNISGELRHWRPLGESPDQANADVRSLLDTEGLPWLESLPSTTGIIADWIAGRVPDMIGSPKPLIVILFALRGDRERAAQELALAYVEAYEHRGHQQYLASLADVLGLPLLALE